MIYILISIFNIYAIKSIEEGLEILTGKSIEEIDKLVNENLDRYRKSSKDEEDNEENKNNTIEQEHWLN